MSDSERTLPRYLKEVTKAGRILYAVIYISLPACPRLLLRQAVMLPLLPPAAKGRREVLAVEGLVRHKHVTLGAPGVRSDTLIQYHDCVPHMAVYKVNPEVGPI